MLNELAVAKGEGVLGKMMKVLKRVQLLIIDEWLLVPLTEGESRLLLEIIEARHKKASTVFSSQFAPAGWHGKIGEGPLADAILDRVLHAAHKVKLTGESLRKPEKSPL